MKVSVVGGVNLDIGGFPNGKIALHDSNLGKISFSFGGVGRNIAHNLSLLGQEVSLFSALSSDMFGNNIRNNLIDLKIDVKNSFCFDAPTSTYLFLSSGEGDMLTAVNDMSIYELLTPEIIKEKMSDINEGNYIVLDTNIRKDTLEYVLNHAEKPCIVDGVSRVKARKVGESLSKIHTLKINQFEAEELCGIKIESYEQLIIAVEKLLAQGLTVCVASLGKEGAYVATKSERHFIPAIKTEVVNATGAGDAMLAGIVYGMSKGYSVKKAVKCGISASHIALLAKSAVNDEMSAEIIEKLIKSF